MSSLGARCFLLVAAPLTGVCSVARHAQERSGAVDENDLTELSLLRGA